MAEEKSYVADEFTIDDSLIEEAERDKAERSGAAIAVEEADTVEVVEAVTDGEIMPEEKPKAKRGRKKKADAEAEAADAVADGEVMPEEKPKAKRGRKKKADAEAEVVEAVADGEDTEAAADGAAVGAPVIEDGVELEIVDIMPEIFPLGEGGDDSSATDTSLFDTDEELIIEGGEAIEEPVINGEEEVLPHKDEAIPEATPERRPVARKEAKYDPEKPRRVDFIFDFIELFVFTLAAVLIITTFLVRHSIVEGPSMEGTLQSGDTLLLSNVFYTPKAGDIVVVDDHTSSLPYPIVKRVIAVGGQWVRIARDGVYVDGEKLNEPYVYTDGMNYVYTHHLPGEALLKNPTFRIYRSGINNDVIEYYELEVPEGEIFIMGDHRNASTDSRIIGTVRVDAVLGKVLIRILPFSSFGALE